jgi:broad specificity phosphatase PhoE
MGKTVYLVRHGQSLAYAEGCFQDPDTPLSDKGREQARCVAARLAGLHLEGLLSSTYERALQTAGAISEATGLTPDYSDLLVERIKPPVVGGKLVADEAAHKIWTEWNEHFYTPGARTDGGENFESLISRVNSALEFLQSRPETTLAAVTHGYFLRALVACAVLRDGLTIETYKAFQSFASVENTALTIMRYQPAPGKPAWRVLTYNDYTHLDVWPARTG